MLGKPDTRLPTSSENGLKRQQWRGFLLARKQISLREITYPKITFMP
jgi:hypothetical protein